MRYPAVIALLFLVAGIVGAYFLTIPPWIPIMITAALILISLILLYSGERRYLNISVALLLISLGFARTQLFTSQYPANHISKFTSLNTKLRFAGKIASEPDIRDSYTYLTLSVDSLYIRNKSIPTTGKVLVKIRPATGKFQYGDYVSVYGYLNNPPKPGNPNLFDYRGYLNRKGIYGYCSVKGDYNVNIIKHSGYNDFISAIILPVRRYLLSVFSQLPHKENGALLAGFLIGEKRGIPVKIRNDFIRSGTMHLLAVSGSNVALVSSLYFVFLMFIPIKKRWKLLGSIPVLIIFSFVANNEPSVVRATIMVIIGISAYIWRRRVNPLNIAASAALLILSVYPLWLFDAGFQLSFAAVFGIVLCLKMRIFKSINGETIWGKFKGYIIRIILISAAAFLFTAPIIAYYFNRIATYSLIANIPAAMLISIITFLGGVSIIVFPLGGWLAQGVLLLTDISITVILDIVAFFSSLPYANPLIPSPSLLTIFILYLILLVPLIISWQPRLGKIFLILFLFLLNVDIWGANYRMTQKRCSVEFLDAGYSNAVFVSLPNSSNTLIYAGDKRTYKSIGEKYILPHILREGYRKINNLILTETSEWSFNGLDSLLKENIIQKVWIPYNSTIKESITNTGYGGRISEFDAGEMLSEKDDKIKYIIIKPDNNSRKAETDDDHFAIMIEVFGRGVLFDGKTPPDTASAHFQEAEIMQLDESYAKWALKRENDWVIPVIISGKPFLYWLEGREADYSSIKRIRYSGAQRYIVKPEGITSF